MTSISLLDFFRSGQFGPIQLGMTRQEVYDLLGEPDGYGCPETHLMKAGIWLYMVCLQLRGDRPVDQGLPRQPLHFYLPACKMEVEAIDSALSTHVKALSAEFFEDIRSFNQSFSRASIEETVDDDE